MRKLKKLGAYLFDRLDEASTWVGIILVLTLAGYKLTDIDPSALAQLGGLIIGCIKIFFPDKRKKALLDETDSKGK